MSAPDLKTYFGHNDSTLQKAGATKLFIGIESGSEAVRNHMGKKFNNESLDDTIENLSGRDIMTHWMLITGYPTETQEDLKLQNNLLEVSFT